MTPLEKVLEWLKTYPNADELLSKYHVDYTDHIPGNAGLFPAGLVEVSRNTDVLGNTVVTNQYNFALYHVFTKAPDDDAGALVNADWVMDFQEWVQAESVRGNAPTFGDDPYQETMTAQNGALFETSEEGTAIYAVQLSAKFIKNIEVIENA